LHYIMLACMKKEEIGACPSRALSLVTSSLAKDSSYLF